MNRNEFFQALPVTKLALRLTGATLEICTDDIDDIHVMISGSNADVEALRISEAAGVLTVEQPVSALAKTAAAPGSWMQIAIRLPRTWKGAVESRTVTGWMTVRGISGTFGPDIMGQFCEANGFRLICRAHQVAQEGFCFPFENDPRIITVFSARNYQGMGNKAAVLLVFIEDGQLQCRWRDHDDIVLKL